MNDMILAQKCSLMREAIEEGTITLEHDNIDEKGLVPIVQIQVGEKKILLKFCPFCGESLGNWLSDNTKCGVTKIESETAKTYEEDYDPEPIDDPDPDFSEGDLDES